jgi:hypothetical protein
MNVNPRCCKSKGLGDLFSSLVGDVLGMGSGGSSSGGTAAAQAQPISVNPQISTQISPSISPIFQQQFQPTNSAATAGTASAPSFGAPGMPASSSQPGFAPSPYSNLPTVPGVSSPGTVQAGLFGGSGMLPWLILGGGILGYVLLTRQKGRSHAA